MRRSSAAVAIIAAALALSGCASVADQAESTPSPTGSPTSTTSPVPAPSTPAMVVLSVDQIAVLDAAGGVLVAAPYGDPDAVLALLGSVEGTTPEPVDNQKFGMRWEWPDVRLTSNYWAFVQVTAPQLAGLPVQTSQGIHVGSTRAEVQALDPHDWNSDDDGDGVSDRFCLEVRPEPGKVSLVDPAAEGITCVGVTIAGDAVTAISSMSNDWFDI